jgi:Ca-activated chloride channel family protein
MKLPEGFGFAHPALLLLLLALPFLALLQGARGAAPAVVFSSLRPLHALGRVRRSRIGGWLTTLLLFALALFIIALARPQMGKTISKVQASGIDIMLALDVSASMYAEDFTIGGERANRLEVVKQVTQKFIEARPNDRIGITCFAGRPDLVSPLTLDHDWLLKNLERLRIGLVEDGTSIGSALASAANRMKDKKAKSKIIVLLTDGDENITTIPPATAAEAAKTLGIKIYTIAAGTNGLAPFPVGRDFLGNKVYQNVPVKVDEGQLRKVAEIGGGKFFVAMDTNSLNKIFSEIDTLEKTEVKLRRFTIHTPLFQWPLLTALGLFTLELLLANTLLRRVP